MSGEAKKHAEAPLWRKRSSVSEYVLTAAGVAAKAYLKMMSFVNTADAGLVAPAGWPSTAAAG